MERGYLMDLYYSQKLELFTSNKEAIDKAFKLEFGASQVAAALIFTNAGRTADTNRMKTCHDILKKKAGIFSPFRDSSELIVLARMALENYPEQYIDELISIYKEFGKKTLYQDNYVLLTAMIIQDRGQKDNTAAIKEKTIAIMKAMADKHPILTGSEDLALAALLAMTGHSVEHIIGDMEECYNYAKKELRLKADSNAIQALAQILALGEGEIRSNCDKVTSLFNEFKAQGSKFGSSTEFPAIASLIDIEKPKEQLVAEVIEASAYLKKFKGFGSFYMDNKDRLMYASLLANSVFASEPSSDASVIVSNAIMMAIAEEMALIICMMTASVAAASTSN